MASLIAIQGAASTPEPIERIPPIYPAIGGMHGVIAKCMARYDVLTDGSVSNICMICNTSLPADIPPSVSEYVTNQFVTEARAAVSQWRFTPSENGDLGRNTGVEFQLNGRDDIELDWPDEPGLEQCPDSPLT